MQDGDDKRSVAVIGGGASGLMAAIAAARAGASVTLLEARDRVGKKILRTGDGRCNLTNVAVSPSAYNDPDFVAPILSRYPYESIRLFFEELGLYVYEDERGRIFPFSNTATSVLDVLCLECDHLGVQTLCRREVMDIQVSEASSPDERFSIHTRGGEITRADAVVLATGDEAGLLGLLGHHRVKQRPVLCPLRCEREALKGLEGIRVQAMVTLLQDGLLAGYEEGEVLFKKDGVSGIPILDMSRIAEPGDVLSVDLFPGTSEAHLADLIEMRCEHLGWRAPEDFLTGMLHSRLAAAVRRMAGETAAAERLSATTGNATTTGPLAATTGKAEGADPLAAITDTPVIAGQLPTCLGGISLQSIAHVLKDYRLHVVGQGDAKAAQVTSGGGRNIEFDPETLESKLVSGFHATGEVLDVDGKCGGFNLHWAWASGQVAGAHAAVRP